MEIIRTSAYAAALKRLKKLGASSDDIIAMEDAIARAPETGTIIRGANGLRKIRFGYGGRGKSVGGRTIYYVMLNDDSLFARGLCQGRQRGSHTEREAAIPHID